MWLFRLAFWTLLVLLLLPTDEQQQERLYTTAVVAVQSASTFCDRNGTVCEGGQQLWANLVKKAEFAGRMAVNLAKSKMQAQPEGELAPPLPYRVKGRPEASVAPASTRGTLTADDLGPAWRGQGPRAGT